VATYLQWPIQLLKGVFVHRSWVLISTLLTSWTVFAGDAEIISPDEHPNFIKIENPQVDALDLLLWQKHLLSKMEEGSLEIFDLNGKLMGPPVLFTGLATAINAPVWDRAFRQLLKSLGWRHPSSVGRAVSRHVHPTQKDWIFTGANDEILRNFNYEQRSKFSDPDNSFALLLAKALKTAGFSNLVFEEQIIFEGMQNDNQIEKRAYQISGDLAEPYISYPTVVMDCMLLLVPGYRPMKITDVQEWALRFRRFMYQRWPSPPWAPKVEIKNH
jgi:hypothetical protein